MTLPARIKYLVIVFGIVGTVWWNHQNFFESGHPPNFFDLQVYYVAGQKSQDHLTLYDVTHHFQYKYSPIVASVFGATLSQLPWATAKPVFYTLNLLLWTSLFFLFARQYADTMMRELQLNRFGYYAAAAIIVFGVFSVPLRDELMHGQINGLPVLCGLGAVGLLSRRRRYAELLAGFLVAVAILTKLYSGIFLVMLFWQREWRTIGWCLVWLVALDFGLLAIVHGFEFAVAENRRWIETLGGSTDRLMVSSFNISVLGFLHKNLDTPRLPEALWLFLFAFAQIPYFLLRDSSRHLLFAYSLCLVCLFTPLVWSYWIILLVPVFLHSLAGIVSTMKTVPLMSHSIWPLFYFAFEAIQQHPRNVPRQSLLYGVLVLTAVFLFLCLRSGVSESAESGRATGRPLQRT